MLAGLLGKQVLNAGVGGETSAQIAARLGATSCTVTVSGNQIPDGAGAVTVTTTPSLPSVQGITLDGTLAGVRGRLTLSGGTVTFTRQEAVPTGVIASVPPGSPFVADLVGPAAWRHRVVWVGRNNYTSPAQVQADAAALVAQCQSPRYLVLSVLNSSAEPSGAAGYATIVALNTALGSAYGSRFLDIRRYLIDNGLAAAGITPTGQDNTDIAGDVVPSSLRSDTVHLNAAGYTVVAQAVRAKMQALGW